MLVGRVGLGAEVSPDSRYYLVLLVFGFYWNNNAPDSYFYCNWNLLLVLAKLGWENKTLARHKSSKD